MTPKDRTEKQQSATEGRSSAKKPYSKPEFRFERVFETTALACGKTSGVQAQCRTFRKSS
jgi:hypothetical protein